MKYCSKCGHQIADDANVCPNCGTNIQGGVGAIPNRNIALCVILSIITCGIYGLYWYVKLTDEAKQVSGATNANGVTALIFTICTCGIYSIYWNYTMGINMYNAGQQHNKNIENYGVLYLVLGIFGLGIVNYCLIQNDLNKFAQI